MGAQQTQIKETVVETVLTGAVETMPGNTAAGERTANFYRTQEVIGRSMKDLLVSLLRIFQLIMKYILVVS